MSGFFVKNISRKDVKVLDLNGYVIKAGQTVDLLIKNSRLTIDQILKSKKDGDLFKRLGKELVELERMVVAKPPHPQEVIRNAVLVKFPTTAKSSVVVEVGDIAEEIQNITINEEEAFLKQLDLESMEDGGAKLVSDED